MFLKFTNKKDSNTSVSNSDWERNLIEKYRKTGKSEYIGELFDVYVHLVYGVCMKYLKNETECKDGVMEIFETILHDLKTHEVQNMKNWLYSVTKNFCLRQKRIKSQDNRYSEFTMQRSSPAIMETENILALKIDGTESQQIKSLHKAVKNLNAEQRKCIELVYLEQKSYKETVEITGYDLKKVKSYVQNGKRNLEIALSKLNEFSDGK